MKIIQIYIILYLIYSILASGMFEAFKEKNKLNDFKK